MESPAELLRKPRIKLNLGSGLRKLEGYVGVDKNKTEFTDIVQDLEVYPWPFDTSSVEEALMIHVFEHMADPVGIMTELYRVMAPNGTVGIEGPYWTSVGSWQDPDHKHAISEELFWYFNKTFRESQKINYIPEYVNFEIVNVNYILHEDYKKLREENKLTDKELEWAIRHNVNVVTNFAVVLKTIK